MVHVLVLPLTVRRIVLEAFSLEKLLSWEPPKKREIIGAGILHRGTRLLLFGKPKSWKSMVAIHTGFCIATGQPWFGFRTTPSRVMILQLEIPQALFRERIIKYCDHASYQTALPGSIELIPYGANEATKIDLPDNIYFCYEPYIKLDRDFQIARLEQLLLQVQPDVLIVDPLYKVMSGNICDAYAVEVFQSNIDKMAAKLGGLTTIIVAHTRQQKIDESGQEIDYGADDLMGSSNWPNWVDSLVRVKKVGDDESGVELQLSFEAMRHTVDNLHPVNIRTSREHLQWSVKL